MGNCLKSGTSLNANFTGVVYSEYLSVQISGDGWNGVEAHEDMPACGVSNFRVAQLSAWGDFRVCRMATACVKARVRLCTADCEDRAWEKTAMVLNVE